MAIGNDNRGSVDKFPLVAVGSAQVSALVSVVRRLSIAQSVQEVMETVTQPARALLGAGGITFVLREGHLCYYAEEDAISPLWKGRRFPMEACISGWCMKEGRTVAVRDIYQDPRIPHDAYRPTFVRSLAMVPVLQEDPIAAMGAYWPEVREPRTEEIELLQTIANAAALAIANAELRRERVRKARQREELTHRIKNLFSVVQALANQTAGGSVAEYRRALLGRLRALERVHSQLATSSAETAEIRGLVQTLLFPLVQERQLRFELSGPILALPQRTATDLAFILHELGTNALKYGALSVPNGMVEIRWECGEDEVRIDWRERNGPPVELPERTGFGTTLVQGLASPGRGGQSSFSYGPDGLRCSFSLPLYS